LTKYFNKHSIIDIEYCNYDDINEKVEEFLLLNEDFNYDKVFITDISVNESIADWIQEKVYLNENEDKFILLDHHKTAEFLNKYTWATVVTDYYGFKVSGTSLLHDYFTGNIVYNKNTKLFSDMVRDYDTWRWNEIGDLNPKKLNDLYYIYGKEMFIDKILTYLESPNENIFTSSDELILKLKQNEIDSFIEIKNNTMIKYKIGEYVAGVVFAESFISELGNRLCKINSDIDFAVIININHSLSFRTIKDIDVSAIAKSIGGGGHSKSSGAPINIDREEFINELLGGIKC